MKDYMIEKKLNLLIENYNELKKVKGSWQMGMMHYSTALSFTLKDKKVCSKSVEESIEIIKNNTGIFSEFRGYNLFYMATLLSFEESSESSFRSILDIYKELKLEKFWSGAYLPLAAVIIYENRSKMDIYTAITRMKYVYQNMKEKHPFLTSTDDYCNAALIAIYSTDLDKDLENIEESYNFLSKNGFYKGNELQALSHILSFSEDKTVGKCNKVIELKKIFKDNKYNMYGYGLPIIGAISLLDYEDNTIMDQMESTSEDLKKVKGFGNWTLGQSNRNMISASIIVSIYADEIKEKNRLSSVTNSIFMNIVIAIEVACMVAATSAVIAASSSN